MKLFMFLVMGILLAGIVGALNQSGNSTCVGEGGSLGALIPENTVECCPGLVAYVPYGLLDTRGTCVKAENKTNQTCPCEGDVYPNCRVGCNTDSHGCVTDGGYTWCESLQKCIRTWETDCSNETNRSNITRTNTNYTHRMGQELSRQIAEKRTEFRSGNFTTSLGKFLNVREIVAGLLELRDKNISAKTKLNLTKVDENNESRLEVNLSNGRKAEIKIMPLTASETALARLRLRVCNETNNCTIELKEVGSGNNTRIGYNIQIERHSRILGIFQKKMQVGAEVDAETGAVISEHKPWWAFLATQPAE